MVNQEVSCGVDELPLNHIVDEEDFRSCCGDEEVWFKESDVTAKVTEEEKDESSVKMFFKGVSISERGDSSGSGYSGNGIVLERSGDFELFQVQKKLDFYVEECAANYLALIDGLTLALQNNLCSVVAVTDSEFLYNQITNEEKLEVPLLVALRERVFEKRSSLDGFVLKLAPLCDLEQALSLAQVAVGICNRDVDKQAEENCSICCEDRLSQMMLTLKCTHKFCSHCMKTYVQGKVESSEVPIRCPQAQCKHHLSSTECKTFLPVASFRSFEEANMRSTNSGKIYCPYPNCSFLLDPRECLSSESENSSCVKCPLCERFVCVDCGVPCAYWDDEEEEDQENTIQELEQWPWDTFSSVPSAMDAYSEQERSQLALIQRFLAGGGFSLSDHHASYQSLPPPAPPCRESSHVEAAMKDLHQLPWLERFVSVISDDYYEEYIIASESG